MKTETREITRTELQYVYIADDGKEFKSRFECENYEGMQLKKYPEVIRTAKKFYTFDEENSATVYYIKDLNDWEYLKEYKWDHSNIYGNFDFPGYYIAVYYDGGDHRDSYYIYRADKYFKELKENFEKYEKDFLEIISST